MLPSSDEDDGGLARVCTCGKIAHSRSCPSNPCNLGGRNKREKGTPKKCRPSALPKGKRVAKGKGVVKMSHKRKSLTPSHRARKRRNAREKKSCKRLKLESEATEVKSSISDDESLGLDITGVKEGVLKLLCVLHLSGWTRQECM